MCTATNNMVHEMSRHPGGCFGCHFGRRFGNAFIQDAGFSLSLTERFFLSLGELSVCPQWEIRVLKLGRCLVCPVEVTLGVRAATNKMVRKRWSLPGGVLLGCQLEGGSSRPHDR